MCTLFCFVLLSLSRSHEYLKHGTCTGLKEFDFFNKVLEIYQDLPHIGNAFNNADVVPNNQKMYDVSEGETVCAIGHYCGRG